MMGPTLQIPVELICIKQELLLPLFSSFFIIFSNFIYFRYIFSFFCYSLVTLLNNPSNQCQSNARSSTESNPLSHLNEHVTFFILNPHDLFQVGSTSGVVQAINLAPFVREVQPRYVIVAYARSKRSG